VEVFTIGQGFVILWPGLEVLFWSAGLVGGNGVVFWSGFLGGLELEGNGGGSRGRRRSHYERRRVVRLLMAEGRGWEKENYRGQVYKD
jgi:hypothetical protein